MMITVDVVLPCLDEAESLPAVIRALPPGCRALVVDNGSTEGTPEVARVLGARVVHERRGGYGAAVHAGLEHAEIDLVAVLDAVGSLDPAVLPELIAVMAAGRADLAVGRRVPTARAVQPWHARAGNALLAARTRSTSSIGLLQIGMDTPQITAALLHRCHQTPATLRREVARDE